MSSELFTWYMSIVSPLLGNSGISLTKESVELFPLCGVSESYDLSEQEMKEILVKISL